MALGPGALVQCVDTMVDVLQLLGTIVVDGISAKESGRTAGEVEIAVDFGEHVVQLLPVRGPLVFFANLADVDLGVVALYRTALLAVLEQVGTLQSVDLEVLALE